MDPTAEEASSLTNRRSVLLWAGFGDPTTVGSTGEEFLACLHLTPEDHPRRLAVLSSSQWDTSLSGWLPEGLMPSVALLSCAMLARRAAET
eukprot:5299918-Amphidinium_carterae.1